MTVPRLQPELQVPVTTRGQKAYRPATTAFDPPMPDVAQSPPVMLGGGAASPRRERLEGPPGGSPVGVTERRKSKKTYLSKFVFVFERCVVSGAW